MQAGLKQLIEHVGSLHERGTKGGNSRTVWTFFNRIHPSESLSELAFVSAGGKKFMENTFKTGKTTYLPLYMSAHTDNHASEKHMQI